MDSFWKKKGKIPKIYSCIHGFTSPRCNAENLFSYFIKIFESSITKVMVTATYTQNPKYTMTYFAKRLLGIALTLVLSTPLTQAQYEMRLWNSFGVNAPLTKNLSAKASYMKSFRFTNEPFETSFNWYSLRLSYNYNRDWNFSLGSAWMNLPGSNRTTFRMMGEATHRIKLDRRFVLRNSLQLETHNDQESRFDQRIISSSRLGLRKRIDFLKAAPSLSYSLFYNIGGNPIRYFDEQGEEIDRKSANGIHRARIMGSFNFKLSTPLRLTVYYINQHEFNLVLSDTNKINIPNPNTGRVQRPFNNQHIVGVSLSYQLSHLLDDNLLPFNF